MRVPVKVSDIASPLTGARVKSAIDACTFGPGNLHRCTDATQSLNAGYCNDNGPAGNLQLRGEFRAPRLCPRLTRGQGKSRTSKSMELRVAHIQSETDAGC